MCFTPDGMAVFVKPRGTGVKNNRKGGIVGGSRMYKIIIDSCGELTEELKADVHYISVALEMEVNGTWIVDDETFDQQDFMKKVIESAVGQECSCTYPDR